MYICILQVCAWNYLIQSAESLCIFKKDLYLNFLLKRNLLNGIDNSSYHLNVLYITAILSVLHVK